MSQRHSGYGSQTSEFYTPHWVTEALLDVEVFTGPVWEPAPGERHICDVLKQRGYVPAVTSTNFLEIVRLPTVMAGEARSLVTNPPYDRGLVDQFVRHALEMMRDCAGKVAMLLPIGFDAGKTRRDIFADHPAFSAQHVLTERIRWANLEQKEAGPSANHAWFVWDWRHRGPPQKGYLP